MTEERRRELDPVIEGLRRDVRDLRQELTTRSTEIKQALVAADNLQELRHKSNLENFIRLNGLADRINWGWKVLIGICVIIGGTTKFIFNAIDYARNHLR